MNTICINTIKSEKLEVIGEKYQQQNVDFTNNIVRLTSRLTQFYQVNKVYKELVLGTTTEIILFQKGRKFVLKDIHNQEVVQTET